MKIFESAVAAALDPCPLGTVFLAAVSGGADSTAMLLALTRLRETRNFTLHCIHIEHGIRQADESRGDAEAVKALCRALDVPCKVVSIPPGLIAETAKCRGLGIEAVARHYRHGAWAREARRIGAVAVLVAHTRDDALETALMRVLRGSGPAGLAAMPAVRGLIRRPLLNLGRADVLRYLKEQGVPYRTDSTNQDNQYLRNRLRNRLIPLLDELFPHWKKGVAAMAEIQSRTAAFLAGEAGRRVVWERVPAQGTDEVSPDTARKESIAAEGEWTGTDAAGVALRTNGGNFFAQPDIIREEALFQGIDLFKISLKDSGGGDGGLWREGDGLRSSEGDILPEDTPVRRSSLRLFSRNGTAPSSAPPMPPFVPLISPALDLGFCRISVKGASVIIGPGRNPVGEAGFSLLIKEPGIYKLNRLSLEVRSLGAFDAEKEPLKGFYAALPLILRPGFKGDVIIDRTGRRVSFTDVRGRAEFQNCAAVSAAVDERGAAAFIGAGPDGTIRVLCRDESAGSSGGPSFFVALSHSVCP